MAFLADDHEYISRRLSQIKGEEQRKGTVTDPIAALYERGWRAKGELFISPEGRIYCRFSPERGAYTVTSGYWLKGVLTRVFAIERLPKQHLLPVIEALEPILARLEDLGSRSFP